MCKIGDWICLNCNNVNYTNRKDCNKCHKNKSNYTYEIIKTIEGEFKWMWKNKTNENN